MSQRDPWTLVNALLLSGVAIAALAVWVLVRPWRVELLHDAAARARVRGAAPRAEAVRCRGASAGCRRPAPAAGAGPVRGPQALVAPLPGRFDAALARGPHLLRHRRTGTHHVSYVVQVQRHHLGGVLVDGGRDGFGLRRAIPVRAHSEVHSRRGTDARRDPGRGQTTSSGSSTRRRSGRASLERVREVRTGTRACGRRRHARSDRGAVGGFVCDGCALDCDGGRRIGASPRASPPRWPSGCCSCGGWRT